MVDPRTTPPLPFGGPPPQRPAPRRPAPQAPVAGAVAVSGGEVIVKFSAKHPPFIAAIRSVRGVRWDPNTYCWRAPIGALRQIRRLAEQHSWTLTPAVRALPDIGAEDTPMTVSAQGEQVVIHGAQRDDVWEMLGDSDARYERRSGRWYVPAEAAFDVLMDLQRICSVRYVGDRNDILERFDEAQRMVALSRALWPSPLWELTRPVNRELRPFQHPGVEYLVKARRAFCWATMGAGKTTVALVALNELDAFPVLVIPPKGIKTNWHREIDAVLPGRRTYICEGTRPSTPLYAPDVWVCNYDILGDHTKRHTWSHLFKTLDLAALVTDEGHRLVNPGTQRTKAVIAISNSLPDDAPRFHLTGTPVRNKRTDIHAQLAVIGRDGEFGTKKQIRDDERLARRLRSVCAWRPDPKEVLRSLGHDGIDPDPNIVVVDGDPAVMVEYRKAEANLIDYLREKARAKAIEIGADPDAAEVTAALKASAAEHLMAVNVLAALAGKAKMSAAREWVTDFMDSGDKLLVFAVNRDMLDGIAADTIPQINGDVDHRVRQHLCDRFQGIDGDPLQALALQIHAAGEGLTLTEAWHCLFAQFDWVPGVHDQATARAAWRMNDPHPVQSHYLVTADTIDEVRMDVLDAKRVEMRAVTDGDRETIASTSTFADVFDRLLRRALD